ncbi:MAG: SGNH/GDSL hydrolase family protein [Clostridia bacterium]|nr:SGNH/GDSL hydrolase family protein [Clostridia bacterium]
MDFSDKLLCVFGDSIANGSGNHDFGVGEYLAKDLGFKLKKYAVGGARVGYREGKYWVIDQLKQAIEDGVSPDYIVFDGFTNDCNISEGATKPDVPLGEIGEGYTGYTLDTVTKSDTFSRCFEVMLYTFLSRYPKAKILFFRPHNMGRRDDKLQKLYGERAINLCKKWGVAYVDLYSESGMNTFLPEHRDLFTFDSYNWGKGDCTHPNATGYELKYMPLIESKIKEL